MKKITSLVTSIAMVMGLSAQTPNYMAEKGGLKVTGVPNPKTFLDARLEYKQNFEYDMPDTGMHTFEFEVTKYTLGAQTPDADRLNCANSAKGQHIHFILDNKPYTASYTPTITASLSPGHHVLLAFLSRSYHESIKTSGAYILHEFDAGKKGIDQFDAKGPHLFFSRPKGDYVGKKETQKILLDFYLVNCKLSPNGYKVRATINGNEFMLTTWEPYFIEGLPMGESKIKLELLDKNNKMVICPYNGTERTIKLIEEPAAK